MEPRKHRCGVDAVNQRKTTSPVRVAWGGWSAGVGACTGSSRNRYLVFSTVQSGRAIEVVQALGELPCSELVPSEGNEAGAEKSESADSTDEVGELTPEDPADGKRPTG